MFLLHQLFSYPNFFLFQDCCIARLYVQHIIPNHHPDQLMAKNLDTGEFCRAPLYENQEMR
jgi:hypothetical protein